MTMDQYTVTDIYI